MNFPESVKLVEVGPRDGLQNESAAIAVHEKTNLINKLSDAGLPVIECGSFVSPKWVPQMADTAAVLDNIQRIKGVRYTALTPNLRGYTDAINADADEVAIFAAVTESFSRTNINCSIAESLDRFQPIIDAAAANATPVRGYLSCVLGCPYEGAVNIQQVLHLAQHLLDAGCYEISLGDTIGVGTTADVDRLLDVLLADIPADKIAVHFHDTYGQAIANIHTSLGKGIQIIDSAVAGLGGCPYAAGASGNVATEDVVYLLHGMHIDTGVNLDKLVEAGDYISGVLHKPTASKAARAILAKQQSNRQP